MAEVETQNTICYQDNVYLALRAAPTMRLECYLSGMPIQDHACLQSTTGGHLIET